ncbi:hypothetical protein CVT26_011679 [Gymnopilus dilepis]|uniref:Uncharacterized protein n=1 Tax=Gymnopilus dilepis TaxID=231916 RepID=A0A409WCC2_9AGAR|nr:hypothetical protein CVT26_011679 [Gymnopilus dilepis]
MIRPGIEERNRGSHQGIPPTPKVERQGDEPDHALAPNFKDGKSETTTSKLHEEKAKRVVFHRPGNMYRFLRYEEKKKRGRNRKRRKVKRVTNDYQQRPNKEAGRGRRAERALQKTSVVQRARTSG